ncbi:aldehyde dehydrogenase family protein [Pseudomonas aeruginosa]|uniref:aldehyde dehydrogenase family protein n=1 Tax=Pseudomonas aeruginosa TaxID=287 RepID=UPI0011B64FF9|nr:aldehyde dehydrogenase family protein [Pseudomonas aeruginosa]EKV6491986.1 aldehyde dehydrogenase [Pseudomonas aeruginosa]TWW48440.1 aldehyde dehydrogenase [Pseudomonas aeruginosa]TWY05412.1 aldehyde dehydrogenase [Pseudomonas aeruginosa]HEJ9838655.1 aldehyde dehydrogenase [Pseudomonas aeruginosa]
MTSDDLLKTYRWSSNDPKDKFSVENPATGEIIAWVQGGGAAEIDAAVKAANEAYETDWRHRSPTERGALLLKCADVLEAHADEIARIETLENGKPFTQARTFDVNALIMLFRYFGSIVDKIPGDHIDHGNISTTVVLEPLGVVGAIIPFNWPPIHTAGKLAPALAVGNTVVLKPGEQTPLTPAYIVELLQTVLPENVVSIVPGAGPIAGAALASHPLVRKVTFTGSTKAGAAVLHSAADNITPALLELGGKNAYIVFDDADLDRAVRDGLEGGFFNQGEACTAASRMVVQRGIYDRFVERLAEGVKKLKVGDGMKPETHVGPLVTDVHRKRVQSYIDLGIKDGLSIAAQAELPSDPALKGGFYVKPTLFTNVPADHTLFEEEIFGPVVTVTPFDTEEEAVKLCNQSEYGLVCGIYTQDMEKGFRVARHVDVGITLFNTYNRGGVGMPFGGAKHTGFGREHCLDTLKEFGRLKTIRHPSGLGKLTNWFAVDEIYGPRNG